MFLPGGLGKFWAGKFEVANAIGVSGPTPLRGSIPRLLGAPGGAPAGPGPARAQWCQGVQGPAHLSLLQVRWTWARVNRGEPGRRRLRPGRDRWTPWSTPRPLNFTPTQHGLPTA